jgi:mono/diheme cytochrome c family protein
VLAWLLPGVAPAQGASIERGRLLYENHCMACHATSVHSRSARQAEDVADVRNWVRVWAQDLGLPWSANEVEDVVRYLDASYYQFGEAL